MNVVLTSSPGRKRQMVFVPEINPQSFLFFFEKGNSGYSYSLRDYSAPHHVTERYARDFGWTADQIRERVVHAYDGPFLDVTRLSDWHEYTMTLNRMHGLDVMKRAIPQRQAVPLLSDIQPGRFPVLNAAVLNALPKAQKTGDIRRMLDSPQSEDWVTWNLLNLLQQSLPATWWRQILTQVKEANPNVDLSHEASLPQIRFWQSTASPKEYEAQSRGRMSRSADSMLAARSRDPKPVEGNSEIDVVIESHSALIYVEAKLNSDISMRTTYDADRNQIVRNIDCLLESALDRAPFFWMFVRDTSPSRAYTQLLREYHEHPETLARDLPHREPKVLQKVALGLAVLTWRDIAKDLCAAREGDDEFLSNIKHELWRRIQ